MNSLIDIDRALFVLINQGLANPVFDLVMPIITSLRALLPFLVAGALFYLWYGGKKGRYVLLILIAAVALSDGISSHLIKPWIERLRPCVELEGVRALLGIKTSLSFPSSHAANMAAAATILSYFHRRYLWIFIFAAATIGFSRIYVGVHYPGDVVGGAVIGVSAGFFLTFFHVAIRAQPV